jgi:hypothetical protein
MTTISGVKVRELMERLLEVGLMKVKEVKPFHKAWTRICFF